MSARPRMRPRGRRRGRRLPSAWIAALASVALIGGVLGGGADAAKQVGVSAYRAILQSEVDNAAGGPRNGHDPSAMPQGSLAAAASARNGVGTWGIRPARGVKGGSAIRKPGQVLPDRRAEGVTSGGCLIAYGEPGGQCVPARAPGNRPLSCDYLVRLFTDGVRVRTADPLGLDRNRDGIACGPGDVP
jgi:hypothetical protein